MVSAMPASLACSPFSIGTRWPHTWECTRPMTAILYSLAAPNGWAANSAAAPRNSLLEGMVTSLFWALLFGRARGRRRRDALTAQVPHDVAVVLVPRGHQIHHPLHGINFLVAD